MIEPFIEEIYDPDIDRIVIEEIAEIEKDRKPITIYIPAEEVPDKVDLSKFLHFIRCQGGAGCWGYSMVAMWDIMNEMKCPYSPNLSMRLWMMLHRRRDLWEKQIPRGIFTPDGRFHEMQNPEFGFLQSFGNSTEGTEPTLHYHASLWPEGGWSCEGINEAHNYRLKSEPKKITISSKSFINSLAQGKPIRLNISYTDPNPKKSWGHFIAVVGYNKNTKKFKYVNSYGDKWGKNGFSTYTFKEIDNKKVGQIDIVNAETIEIHEPRPVPAARISLKHTNRSNVHLWLSVEDSPQPRNKIWPHGWDDKSRNLCFTVRLPSEFIWPPSHNNRLVLDLYDAATVTKTGGTLEEFTAAFGGHIMKCSKLTKGPVRFKAREHRRFFIP